MTMELSAIARIAAALVSALLIAFITTPVVKSLAQIVGAVDVPKDGPGRDAWTTLPLGWAVWRSFWAFC